MLPCGSFVGELGGSASSLYCFHKGCARGVARAVARSRRGFAPPFTHEHTHVGFTHKRSPGVREAWALRLASRQGLLGDVGRSPPPAASFSSRSTPSVSIAVLSEGEVWA